MFGLLVKFPWSQTKLGVMFLDAKIIIAGKTINKVFLNIMDFLFFSVLSFHEIVSYNHIPYLDRLVNMYLDYKAN